MFSRSLKYEFSWRKGQIVFKIILYIFVTVSYSSEKKPDDEQQKT